MNFWQELEWRGQLKAQMHTADIEKDLGGGGHTAYIGYDPTAPSLTIGNLVTVALLRRWQLAGNRPIVLMGGATGKIGDPSGKDKERQLLDYSVIEQNIERQLEQMRRLLDFGPGATQPLVVNNADFYKGMDVFAFLRDIGKNITVNYMMSKESVRSRIESESGISFTEFSYQIIQGYDFQYLYQHHGCRLQMGGGDQWGNITTGLEFIRKQGGSGAHGLACPLLTKADGTKFGKSESGNIWLDSEMTSPFKFYQFFINANDADLPKLWRFFSFRSQAEIEALETLSPQEQKRALAEELTDWVHSPQERASVQGATELVFNPKLDRAFLESLSREELLAAGSEIGLLYLTASALDEGISIVDFLVDNKHLSGLNSNAEVRRAIQNKAVAVNTQKIDTHEYRLGKADLLQSGFFFLQNGKKNKFLAAVVRD